MTGSGYAIPRTAAAAAGDPRLVAALELLQEARDVARQRGGDDRQFAVAIRKFRPAGVPDELLRGLVAAGLAAHATETTRAGKPRTFR
jgi:hypothetical protein